VKPDFDAAVSQSYTLHLTANIIWTEQEVIDYAIKINKNAINSCFSPLFASETSWSILQMQILPQDRSTSLLFITPPSDEFRKEEVKSPFCKPSFFVVVTLT